MAKNLIVTTSGAQLQQEGNAEGAAFVQSLHGDYYEAARQGKVFHSSTIIAGKIVLVAAATLAGVFTLHNPLGSGKNLELISFNFGVDSATIVVNTLGLLIQRSLSSGGGGVPTSLTEASVHRLGISGTNVGKVYTIATLTNVAIPGAAGSAFPIAFYPMVTMPATADTNIGDYRHFFQGKIILEPDSLVSVCTSQTTATVSPMAIDWAEHNA